MMKLLKIILQNYIMNPVQLIDPFNPFFYYICLIVDYVLGMLSFNIFSEINNLQFPESLYIVYHYHFAFIVIYIELVIKFFSCNLSVILNLLFCLYIHVT
jgi:hypothetical protein